MCSRKRKRCREFVHENRNGRLAIDKRIMKALRVAAGDTVVWDRGDFYWRLREATDWRKSASG